MQRVLGIGGVFLKAKNPQQLADWYAASLGIAIEPGQTYGMLKSQSADEITVFSTFSDNTEYFGHEPKQRAMVNFRVADLDAMLTQLREAGAAVDDKIDEQDYGRFGWATDPEGNRFELWQPLP